MHKNFVGASLRCASSNGGSSLSYGWTSSYKGWSFKPCEIKFGFFQSFSAGEPLKKALNRRRRQWNFCLNNSIRFRLKVVFLSLGSHLSFPPAGEWLKPILLHFRTMFSLKLSYPMFHAQNFYLFRQQNFLFDHQQKITKSRSGCSRMGFSITSSQLKKVPVAISPRPAVEFEARLLTVIKSNQKRIKFLLKHLLLANTCIDGTQIELAYFDEVADIYWGGMGFVTSLSMQHNAWWADCINEICNFRNFIIGFAKLICCQN